MKVRQRVYENLRQVIKTWEVDTKITDATVSRIQQAIEIEFPAFESEIYMLEKEMTGKDDTTYPAFVNGEEEGSFVPDFIKNAVSSLSTGTKVALGIGLSPLLLAGLVIRLPYVGVKALDRIITKQRMESSFKDAGSDRSKMKEVCEKYAEKTVNSITDRLSLKTTIEEDMQPLFKFIEAQQQRMQGQIEMDIQLLKKLASEEHEQKEIEKVCEALKAKSEVLQRHLKHCMLMNNPAYFGLKEVNHVTLSCDVICSGFMADVVLAKIDDPSAADGHTQVCVRRQREKVQYCDIFRYMKALNLYR